MRNGWNLAEIWEVWADRFPDAAAQVQGVRRYTWAEFDRRADGIAATLLSEGAQHQDKVAHYLTNCPEYLESTFGMFKAALVPVNTNYRYNDDEVVYVWENADVVATVFHGTYTENVDRVRRRLPLLRTFVWVDDGTAPCPEWAIPYEEAAASASGRVEGPWGRSGDDLYLQYTGGTTGMPKGVMWRQDDIVMNLERASRNPLPAEPSRAALEARTTKPGPVSIPVAPLMHGTGAINAINILNLAGCIVTLEGRSFDPVELLDTIERERVNHIVIVGDAFAKPLLRALDAEPGRWDVSSLRVILSSGVIFSAETKAGLLRHNPRLTMIDALGSTESMGVGTAESSKEGVTTSFKLSERSVVLDENLRPIPPASERQGVVALKGRVPVGYYKDPEKTAATFPVIDGVRHSITGDWAEVEADGTIRLLGRGSQCINTGGEKVFPEEVEEALKSHPSVADAAVVGVPDDRFGESVTALVEPAPGATIDEAELIAHVKGRLAGYKAPKRVLAVTTIGRSVSGKLDYRRLRSEALERLGIGSPG